jgi:hypothetical protein
MMVVTFNVTLLFFFFIFFLSQTSLKQIGEIHERSQSAMWGLLSSAFCVFFAQRSPRKDHWELGDILPYFSCSPRLRFKHLMLSSSDKFVFLSTSCTPLSNK